MPHLPPSAQLWKERAEIDYIGPFVKAWAAFNAWYRHASQSSQELKFVKTQPNPVRNRVLPMLRPEVRGPNAYGDNDATKRLKQAICDLQISLDAFRFETTRKGVIEPVSLRAVCITPKDLQSVKYSRSNHDYVIRRVQGGRIAVTIASTRTTQVKFSFEQDRYDPDELFQNAGFAALSQAQRSTLQTFYIASDPTPKIDLTAGKYPELMIGTIPFNCESGELFCGVVEVIYAMRNVLLHGELQPDPQVLACYDPAYRIIMQFLDCIRG